MSEETAEQIKERLGKQSEVERQQMAEGFAKQLEEEKQKTNILLNQLDQGCKQVKKLSKDLLVSRIIIVAQFFLLTAMAAVTAVMVISNMGGL
jgi:hypothetical protein